MNLNQWRRALSLLVAALLLFLALPGLGESFPYVAYATDSVRLRGGPSSKADILTVIRQGDAVLITGSDGNYKIVEYEGRKGYVVSAFLGEGQQASAPVVNIDPKVAANYQLLSNGDEGYRVKALQQGLEELGFYRKAIDSKYGSGTAQAVSDFQKENKLAQTGIADAALQHLLFEGTPNNSRGRATDVKTLPPIPGQVLRPDDRGDAVEALQQTLTTLKYYSGSIDGIYGKTTQDAVRAFQKANKLTSDGIAGKKTLDALARVSQATSAPQATSLPLPQETSAIYQPEPLPEASYPYQTTAAVSVNLRKRASLSAMRMLTIPEGATLTVHEDNGSFLKAEYRGYTGYVAKEFINIPEQYLEGKVLDINQEARINYQTLAPGAEGRAVRALQQALTELGYYNGNIDGKFGAGTTAGIKALQGQNKLRETGIVLPELQQLIFEQRVRNSKNRLVYTKTLPPIDNITMQQGDFGDAVYQLHEMLIQTGHYDSNPGYEYTKATAQAVRAFQKDHSIKVTGKTDNFTLLAIRTDAQVKAPGDNIIVPTQEPLTADNVIIIREGTSGLAVTNLQKRLVELKYYNVTADGTFNADDAAALRHFQRLNRLPVTGIADLATQQTLYTAFAIAADASVTEPVQAGSTNALLKIGSQGDQVRALQSRLITLNFLKGNIDGNFGTQTAAAVTAFQGANNLKRDGIAGSQTLTALYSVNAISNHPAPQATTPPNVTEVIQGSLKVGSRGEEVKNVQQRLIDLKYLTGTADGIYGPRTFLAVKEFQGKNSLEADGLAGKLTIAKLSSVMAIANNTSPVLPTPPILPPAQPTQPSFSPPRAAEVRFANWYTEIRPIAQRLRDVIIYDFQTGEHYDFRFFSLGKHADGTTKTAADTAVMNKVLGEKNWTARPVWVIFSDGRVYMGSTHSHPHEVDYISGNDLNGHLCVHFPREMEEAAQTGPYAVSHQNAILAGWDLTQNMAR